MTILDQLGEILKQYSSSNPPQEHATDHFEQMASQVPQSHLGEVLTNVFRSPETGSFGDNVASMYQQSNPQQQAGILTQLVQAVGGPGVLSNLGLNLPAGAPVTPEQAQQVSPETVKEVANQAQKQNPGIVQQAGEFYSQHPQLVKALGTGIAIWAMQRFTRR
ncbi:MAG TPA: hypothetical protein VNV86_11505 [Candidatus Acidoferrum sp.]|jgi:hypothetical protein|nr:hypothetical protein [Candidatus Acidoferrum sp.]